MRISYSWDPFCKGLQQLADYDFVTIFDADFKPDSDFLVSMLTPCIQVTACTLVLPAVHFACCLLIWSVHHCFEGKMICLCN